MNISTVPIHDNNERYLAISVAAEMEDWQETDGGSLSIYFLPTLRKKYPPTKLANEKAEQKNG